MKTIYLMRHGQTLFNVMDLNQGQCDSPLTPLGIQQAYKARQWFKDNNIQFDVVYSSTLERACDTAEIVSCMPYIRSKGLKEIFLGTKEATANSENPDYPYGDYFVEYGGEGLDAFTDRIYNAIKEIVNKETGTILIVSHGLAIKRFLTRLNKEAKIVNNCGIVHLEYEDEFKFIDIIDPLKENDF